MLTKKNVLSKILLSASLFGALYSTSALAESQYITLETPLESNTPNKTEVLEFFSYTCPHCSVMVPMFDAWEKKLPNNVVLVKVPVAYNASMEATQKMYYVLQALNRLDLHAKLFDAIFKENQKIFTKEAFLKWTTGQGLDEKQVASVFDSFGVEAKSKQARNLTDEYKIDGTPSIAIGGKYVTSPSMTGTYENSIAKAQELLDKVLAGK